ncbi:hypothetical protein ymoll0001_16140 [Yersinia mollaretii ATCC 43969]|uniref:Uncharacterized protein n=1 Tax=Yersinia mollaretii (strain ATCC 43969 / DSM 18520 / CIP 103324 / CNY 7263 / WAIP 204) TaxID=349967 RepID=A0ABM9YE66_YERMW|nr:hypothetical protein ymoll0001_16140 [Yersinia mollaretii ATCC 43969]
MERAIISVNQRKPSGGSGATFFSPDEVISRWQAATDLPLIVFFMAVMTLFYVSLSTKLLRIAITPMNDMNVIIRST